MGCSQASLASGKPPTEMIKDILLNLTVDAARDAAAEYAISVARAFDAHVAGFAFAYEPVIPGSVFGGVALDLVAAARREVENTARSVVSNFNEAARQAGLSAESHLLNADFPSAADVFGRLARRFDISVVAQTERDKLPARQMIIESALFQSGRPVLIVPYIQQAGFKLDNVMVCWDGSRNAARALGDAMPFLVRARAVEVVVVAGEAPKSNEIPGADIAHHLARHGLKVELEEIVSADLDVPNTILSHAADAGTDLIVMGAYGHSRLRELVLGGATRGILNAMTVPTLMSH